MQLHTYDHDAGGPVLVEMDNPQHCTSAAMVTCRFSGVGYHRLRCPVCREVRYFDTATGADVTNGIIAAFGRHGRDAESYSVYDGDDHDNPVEVQLGHADAVALARSINDKRTDFDAAFIRRDPPVTS